MSMNPWNECIDDDRAANLFRVRRRAFTDDSILEREWEQVFNRCWIYVGHESEIPEPGDYQARDVAGRPIIMVRGKDGQVRVLLNTCTHRGALVCRDRQGTTRSFQCPYHAWSFDNCGKLIGTPGTASYPEGFERSDLGLREPPRTDSYRGFVFACFDPNIVGLIEYLAGAREYIDLVCDQSEVGMEIVGGTQEYAMSANWKLLVENSIDGYHAMSTHMRYFRYLIAAGVDLSSGLGVGGGAVDLGNGHAVIEYGSPWGRPVASWTPAFGEDKRAEIEARQAALVERFGEERAHRIGQLSRNMLIFPNLIINDIMAITVRTFIPIAPDRMNVSAWALAPSDESPSDRALRLENFLTFLGPGGYATPDDVEMLESCQQGFANREVEWSDISRGMAMEKPGTADELQMRAFWRRWDELVTGDPPSALRLAGAGS